MSNRGDDAEPGAPDGRATELRVVVTVDDEHVGAINDIARALRDSGMTIDDVFETTGQIVGSIPQDQEPVLAALEGVLAVDRETAFQLPPPDADVQ